MPQLKAADLQHDPIVGGHSRQVIQQAPADVAAQEGPSSSGIEDRRDHGGRGRFPVAAGHCDDLRRTVLDEQFQFRAKVCARLSSRVQPRDIGPNRRIDHDKIGLSKILRAMPAEMNRGDRHVGQQRQRIGQRVFVGRVADGKKGTLPGQPSRSGQAAAEMS